MVSIVEIKIDDIFHLLVVTNTTEIKRKHLSCGIGISAANVGQEFVVTNVVKAHE